MGLERSSCVRRRLISCGRPATAISPALGNACCFIACGTGGPGDIKVEAVSYDCLGDESSRTGTLLQGSNVGRPGAVLENPHAKRLSQLLVLGGSRCEFGRFLLKLDGSALKEGGV